MNYAGIIRQSLERARESGLGFDDAWREAVDTAPEPSWDWVDALPFMRRVFAQAYLGQELPARGFDLHVRRDCKDPTERTPAPVIERCHSGGLRCSEPPVPGQRFCAEHGERLARIREELESEAGDRFDKELSAA